MKLILMTGHCGLIGRNLIPLLEDRGYKVRGFDLEDDSGDIVNSIQLQAAIENCVGIVHLAAVSRVVWGENDPDLCWATNALASENLLSLAVASPNRPWVILASSREVYGSATILPVADNAPLNPVNIYGRSKAYMEKCALSSRKNGLNTAIVRLSNVYGCIQDHADRVLPAFCRNAVEGKSLRVDGLNNLFDFTHIDDVALGLSLVIDRLDRGQVDLPPMHLLPGISTSLLEAAQYAIDAAKSGSKIVVAPSRDYDVSRFVGNPDLAQDLLNWKAKITPQEGIKLLVNAYKEELFKGLCA